jgi:hypothetical protein
MAYVSELNALYVIYNLERSGRLVTNLHYVYSELVSDVPFQKSRARLYIKAHPFNWSSKSAARVMAKCEAASLFAFQQPDCRPFSMPCCT